MNDLPNEIIVKILHKCDLPELGALMRTSRLFNQLVEADNLLRFPYSHIVIKSSVESMHEVFKPAHFRMTMQRRDKKPLYLYDRKFEKTVTVMVDFLRRTGMIAGAYGYEQLETPEGLNSTDHTYVRPHEMRIYSENPGTAFAAACNVFMCHSKIDFLELEKINFTSDRLENLRDAINNTEDLKINELFINSCVIADDVMPDFLRFLSNIRFSRIKFVNTRASSGYIDNVLRINHISFCEGIIVFHDKNSLEPTETLATVPRSPTILLPVFADPQAVGAILQDWTQNNRRIEIISLRLSETHLVDEYERVLRIPANTVVSLTNVVGNKLFVKIHDGIIQLQRRLPFV